nr:helix-turn-helix transcriptional regulator [Rhizobium sp. Root482]
MTKFTTPGGEEMVMLGRAEYDALVEMAEMLEDVAAYDEAKRRIAEGDDLRVPLEFVDRLIDGENPVRVWRDFRGMASKDLAKAVGISAAYLSEIETGKKDGSLSVFRNIAKALRVDIDDLFWGEDRKSPVDE